MLKSLTLEFNAARRIAYIKGCRVWFLEYIVQFLTFFGTVSDVSGPKASKAKAPQVEKPANVEFIEQFMRRA